MLGNSKQVKKTDQKKTEIYAERFSKNTKKYINKIDKQDKW